MSITQGGKANKAGKAAEDQIAGYLTAYGYQELSNKERAALNKDIGLGDDPAQALSCYGDKVFVQQVRGYETLYGRRHAHDFLAYNATTLPDGLVIEMKWQTSGGSVDEKLPFVVGSFKAMPVTTAMLVIDGGGIRPCAIEWAIAQNDSKFIAFGTIGDFSRWIRKN